MLHFKCEACRFRLISPAMCPGCGSPVEQVRDLAEIVGFRSVRIAGPSEPPADGHTRLAARVREVRTAAALASFERPQVRS